jgi:hypothetical protein
VIDDKESKKYMPASLKEKIRKLPLYEEDADGDSD